MNELEKLLIQIAINTANNYGGYEGLDDDEQIFIKAQQDKIINLFLNIVGENEELPIMSQQMTSEELAIYVRNDQRHELRAKIKALSIDKETE